MSMKITFWKSFGMGVVDSEPPRGVLAALKREFAEDMHTLKYIVFNATTRQASVVSSTELDQILELADVAKRFNLNLKEFIEACKSFCSSEFRYPDVTLSRSTYRRVPRKSLGRVLLPPPKPGLILFRRDSRRKGSCKIIQITQNAATVIWRQSGKHSKVDINNLRNPALYSVSSVFKNE
jgi:hypothetical protein